MNRRRIVVENSWFKCYGDGWMGIITPGAFRHPAKFSRALIRRIYAHAIEEGWVEAGSVIIDPFGGVALGGLEAMRRGLHWVGVELEDRFVQLGQQNIDLWNSRYAEQMPNWGSAVIVQGDSRRLGEVLAGAQLCLSSPPFSTSLGSCAGGGGCLNPANKEKYKNTGMANWKWGQSDYGQAEGNLGNLPDTGFEAALAVSSPAYIGSTASDDPDKRGGLYRDLKRRNDKTLTATYSEDEAQLVQMPEGNLALAISSPPFLAQSGGTNVTAESGPLADISLLKRHSAGNQAAKGYGSADGQLAALPEGDHTEACERPRCCIASPPYAQSPIAAFDSGVKCSGGLGKQFKLGNQPGGQAQVGNVGYGNDNGQLGAMPTGDHAAALEAEPLYAGCLDNPSQKRDYTGTGGPIDSRVGCEEALEAGAETGRAQACISSPSWEASAVSDDIEFVTNRPNTSHQAIAATAGYGSSEGQLGQQQGSTFWAASREILEEVYKVLAPGGHAIWVVKAFVRNKAIIDFPGQWRKLCESVGFRTLHEHHAILTEDRGAQHTLDGGLDVRQVKRASFFRRLHESKYPHLAINHEVVLCMIKET